VTPLPKFYLYKRANGIYYIGYLDNGRRRWKSTGSTLKCDALKALASYLEFLREKPKTTHLATFKRDFLAYAEGVFAQRTVIIYRQALQRLLDIAGDCSLSSLTQRHLDRYATERLGGKTSPVTINIETRAIKAAFSTAVRWQLLVANPFAGVKSLSVPQLRPVFFTRADFEALLAAISEAWLRELVIFSVATGMRQAEVTNLRWCDVDLEHRLIHVQSSPTFKTKQGRRRTIPLGNIPYAILAGKGVNDPQNYVFSRCGRKIGESFLTHRFKKRLRDAKLDERLHWHSLRHTHASWLVQSGATLYEVQKLLGHSSSATTQVYAHLQPEAMHETVNRIGFSA
jgi:site-specific recombinase XerD